MPIHTAGCMSKRGCALSSIQKRNPLPHYTPGPLSTSKCKSPAGDILGLKHLSDRTEQVFLNLVLILHRTRNYNHVHWGNEFLLMFRNIKINSVSICRFYWSWCFEVVCHGMVGGQGSVDRFHKHIKSFPFLLKQILRQTSTVKLTGQPFFAMMRQVTWQPLW